MRLFSWNERDNPDLPTAQVRSDAQKVARRFRGPSIGGGQEFGEVSDHRAVDRAFGGRWIQLYRYQSTPIILNRFYFAVLDLGYVQTHKGVGGVTPHRGFAWAKVKHRRRLRLRPFYFYNTHMVSKPNKSAQRAAFYSTHVEKMRNHIAAKAADGLDTFIVGDFNKKTAPHLHDRQRVLISHWLDHIIWIPGDRGNTVQLHDTVVMQGPLYTDHKPVGVTLSLSPKDSR